MTSPLSQAASGPDINYGPGDIAKGGAAAVTKWAYSGDNATKATVVTDLDRAGGGFSLLMDGTDNDCETVEYQSEVIDPTSIGNVFGFEAVIQVFEQDVDPGDSNWFIGFSDTFGASFFGDTGGLQSQVAFGIYKVESSLFFRTCAQIAAAQSGSTTTTAVNPGTGDGNDDAPKYRVRMDATCGTAGIDIVYRVNGAIIETVTGVTRTGTGLMAPGAVLANGGANAEIMRVLSFTPYSHPAS